MRTVEHRMWVLSILVCASVLYISCFFKDDPTEPTDNTPPSSVTDLSAENISASTLKLMWTAPGDDAMQGTAAEYDIRYSISIISENNWGAATQIQGEPAPSPAGTRDSLILEELSDNAEYYFALKTGDDASNWSLLSNVASATVDNMAPAAIFDMTIVATTCKTITVTWTAPGDDGTSGTATEYDIRYATHPIDSLNWDSAVQCPDEPLPSSAGTQEFFTVTGLSQSTQYYIAIRTRDEIFNWSTISGSLAARTPNALTINEIYYSGCSAVTLYYYDQFFELYNACCDTLYLDGYILCRTSQVEEVLGDVESYDYSIAYYVYQFPGTRGVTKDCPIGPNEYLVIASDAYDHSLMDGNCVDLSTANWETYNASSSDFDNPAVPNLLPYTHVGDDFLTNLIHGAIWLSTGEGIYFEQHWDGLTMKDFVHVPLASIVDGVEYASSITTKYLTVRVDGGLAGIGMIRYSGLSIERRYPGLDSNNSTYDFQITVPSPGWSSTSR